MMDPTAIFWRPRVLFRTIFSQLLSAEMAIYLNFSEAGPGYRGLRLRKIGSLVSICGFSKRPKSTAAAKEPQFHHCKNPKVLLFMIFEADDLESRCHSFT